MKLLCVCDFLGCFQIQNLFSNAFQQAVKHPLKYFGYLSMCSRYTSAPTSFRNELKSHKNKFQFCHVVW